MTLYYTDYYFIFILLFLFIFNIFFCHSFIQFKYNKTVRFSNAKIYFLNFGICLFFILLSIMNCNFFSSKNTFSVLFVYKIIILIFFILFILLCWNFSKLFKTFNFESIWILMFSFFSLTLILESNNFLSFYILLECYSLSIVSVLVLKKLNKRILNASFNYLIINILASCLFLYAASLIYFSTGFLNFNSISNAVFFINVIYFNKLLLFSFFIILLVFLIKLAVFPFSIFFLNIYSSLPPVFVFFFLIIPKFCFSMFFLHNFADIIFLLNNNLINLFLFLLIITSIIHSLFSIKNLNIKELIINTSFSNTPFLLAPVFCKSFFLVSGLFYFFIIYYINLFMLFSVIFIFSNNSKNLIKRYNNLYGIIFSNFTLALFIIITMLSLASLPPFSGFFIKFFMLYNFVEYKFYYVYIILSIINLILVYSYLKVIKIFFFKKRNLQIKYYRAKKTVLHYFISLAVFINVFYFLFFQVVFEIIFLLLNFNCV